MHISKTALAIALLLAPTGAVLGANTVEEGQSVEHHTTFVEIVVDEDEDDKLGYGAVAGIVRCEATNAFDNAVLWFNDEVLFRKGKQGPQSACLAEREITHAWLTEDDAPDPRENPSLRPTGVVFDFTDPNGQHWTVTEYRYHVVYAVRDETTEVHVGDVGATVTGEADVRKVQFYTWVVEIGEKTTDPTIREEYNFVNVVDFDKLRLGPEGETTHDGTPSDPRDGNSHDASDPDERHAFPHEHAEAEVAVWLGGEPEPGQPGEDGAQANVTVITPDQVDGFEAERGPASVE